MMFAALVEQNHKLRAKVARQERQLRTMGWPQIYLLNMAICMLLGVVLGFLLFFVSAGGC